VFIVRLGLPFFAEIPWRMEMDTPVQIICGDALEVLDTLPDSHVSLTVTSPPYYRHRD
jgi:DNA modification methylase